MHAFFCVTDAGLVSIYEDSSEGSKYHLGAELRVSLPGLERSEIDELIQAADKTCPFSNAVRGNVDVRYTSEPAVSPDKPSNL